MSEEGDRALFAALAALLATGRSLDSLSRCITAAVVLGLLLSQNASAALIAPLLLGIAQTYVALRVAFDSMLFAALAQGSALPSLAAMDTGLLALKILPANKVGRPAFLRAAGARRLLRLQVFLLSLQVLTVLAAALSRTSI